MAERLQLMALSPRRCLCAMRRGAWLTSWRQGCVICWPLCLICGLLHQALTEEAIWVEHPGGGCQPLLCAARLACGTAWGGHSSVWLLQTCAGLL